MAAAEQPLCALSGAHSNRKNSAGNVSRRFEPNRRGCWIWQPAGGSSAFDPSVMSVYAPLPFSAIDPTLIPSDGASRTKRSISRRLSSSSLRASNSPGATVASRRPGQSKNKTCALSCTTVAGRPLRMFITRRSPAGESCYATRRALC
jgi:hypothetical protein